MAVAQLRKNVYSMQTCTTLEKEYLVDSHSTTDEIATEYDYMEVITGFLDTKPEEVSLYRREDLQKAVVFLVSKAYSAEVAQETERKRYENGREEVLELAKSAVLGDRNAQYGEPDQDFKRTADLWNILSLARFDALTVNVGLQPDVLFFCREQVARLDTAMSVADKMVALKLSRNTHMQKLDNYIDIAGYAACGYEAVLRNK